MTYHIEGLMGFMEGRETRDFVSKVFSDVKVR